MQTHAFPLKHVSLISCEGKSDMEHRHAAAAFAAGAAVGLSAALLYTRAIRSQNTAADHAAADHAAAVCGQVGAPPSVPAAANGRSLPTVSMADFDRDEILEEQLTRNVQFFGLEAQRRIGSAFVVVVGLGVSWRPESEGRGRAAGRDGVASVACKEWQARWVLGRSIPLRFLSAAAGALAAEPGGAVTSRRCTAGRGFARCSPAAALWGGTAAAHRL